MFILETIFGSYLCMEVFKARGCMFTHVKVSLGKEEKRGKDVGRGTPQPSVVNKMRSNQ